MRKKLIGLLVSVLVLSVVGCAGIQAKWDALTPDQKARVIINDLQGQLENAFNQGKAYVVAMPIYQEQWKAKIVPSFDVANKAIATTIAIGKTKPLTPEFVYAQVQTQVTAVLNLLVQIGAIK